MTATETQPWTEPTWLAGAHAWIEEQTAALGLVRDGATTQPHVTAWATVIRVPTTTGPVWFKANSDALRHEAALVGLLSDRAPAQVSPLLAADVALGWMLMADAGERLRELVPAERSLERWHPALDAVARVSLALEDDVDALLAIGVPDCRLTTLLAGYDALVAEVGAAPRVVEAREQVADLAARLAAYGITETVQHDDLHDGQVFVRDGEHRVMDWGDACVSHPFFVLSVALEGQIAWGLDDVEDSVDTAPFRDTFLAPYAVAYPRLTHDDLVEAARLATRLGWACRAVNGHIPGDDERTHQRLSMFVDGRV